MSPKFSVASGANGVGGGTTVAVPSPNDAQAIDHATYSFCIVLIELTSIRLG